METEQSLLSLCSFAVDYHVSCDRITAAMIEQLIHPAGSNSEKCHDMADAV